MQFSFFSSSERIAQTEASSTNQKRRRHLRKADTNVLSVRFDRLLQPGMLFH